MGLIKSAIGALGGTLADSWKEAIHKRRSRAIFYCKESSLAGCS